jgi:hypothetical protein
VGDGIGRVYDGRSDCGGAHGSERPFIARTEGRMGEIYVDLTIENGSIRELGLVGRWSTLARSD